MSDVPPPPPPGGTPPPPPPGDLPSTPPAAPPPAPPAPPVPPAAPVAAVGAKPPSNGMAIAALVLGILSFICLGPIAGIAAIVLGVIGMNKAKEMGGTGKGMALTGMILGIIGTIVSIIILVVFVFAADKASDEISSWTGKADPSEYSYTIDSCKVDSMGYPTMALTVKNKTSKEKTWTFDYSFRTGSGAIVDNGTTFPQSVPANDSYKVTIDGYSEATGKLTCEITGVNNWFN